MEENPIEPQITGIVTRENWSQIVAFTADTVTYENSPLAFCDLLEFRGDTFEGAECLRCWDRFTQALGEVGAPSKTIFTLRLQRDGGMLKDQFNRGPLYKGLEKVTAPDFLDIEIEHATGALDLLRTIPSELILSYHSMTSFPGISALEKIYDSMNSESPYGVKFAVHCDQANDCLELLKFAHSIQGNFALTGVMGMGPYGRVSRLLSPMLGAQLVYAYLGKAPTVPGQWEASKLSKALQVEQASPSHKWTPETLTSDILNAYAQQYQG